MGNTVLVGIVVVAITLVVALPAGYALARLSGSWGRSLGVGIFLVYLVPPTLLFLPLSRVIAELGLQVGPERIAKTAQEMGIQTKVSTNPAMILGGLETDPQLETGSLIPVMRSAVRASAGPGATSRCGAGPTRTGPIEARKWPRGPTETRDPESGPLTSPGTVSGRTCRLRSAARWGDGRTGAAGPTTVGGSSTSPGR